MKYLIPLIIISIFFFGCPQQHTIFHQIEQETELEEPVVTGTVNSIVKFGEKLYVCDGNIYSKNVGTIRDWSKLENPGGFISKLAADSAYLYALSGTEPSKRELYTTTDGTKWNKVDVSSVVSSINTIFGNGKDAAYLEGKKTGATETTYFKLSGTSSSLQTAPDVSSIVLLKTDTGIYTAKDGTVFGKGNDSSNNLGSVSDLGTIYALTYSTVDKAIYAGTSKGLRKLPVDSSGKLTGANEDPPGNWGATIKNHQSFAVIATGETVDNAALYSSTIDFGSINVKVNGLWGYYYSRRGTWNRE